MSDEVTEPTPPREGSGPVDLTDPPEPEAGDPEEPETKPRRAARFRRSRKADAGEPATEPDATEPAETAETTETTETAPGTKGRGSVPSYAWLLLVAAIVAVILTFLSWRHAENSPERARAELRDSAVIEGTAAVETMNSMDHRDVAAGFKAWQAVSTGVLHDQLASVGEDEKQLVAEQGKITTGHVVQAALTELTKRTATLIAAVEVTVRTDDAATQPTVKRNRFAADLVLVGGQWKIENLQQVAVSTS